MSEKPSRSIIKRFLVIIRNTRDQLREELGDSYHDAVAPFMSDLRSHSLARGCSHAKAFEELATEPLANGDRITLALYSAAVVELYEEAAG